jgi:hypothetical protein
LKHVRQPRPYLPIAVALTLGLFAAFGPAPGGRVAAQVPPGPSGNSTPAPTYAPLAPTPGPIDIPTPTPTPSPTPAPRGRHRGRPAPSGSPSGPTPEPSATPTSPAFATLDGTWELQLQFIDRTEYSYLVIAQQPTGAITGAWRVNGKAYPFEGTYDGRLIRMLVKEPKATVTMSGYVEGASDIVGILDPGTGSEGIAFTAEHRASSKGTFSKKSAY